MDVENMLRSVFYVLSYNKGNGSDLFFTEKASTLKSAG